MFAQKREKLTATIVLEKPRPQQSLVQLEGKLTPEQLEAISKRSAERQRAGGKLSQN